MLLEALLNLNKIKERQIDAKILKISSNAITNINNNVDGVTVLLNNGESFFIKNVEPVDLSNYYSKLEINTIVGNIDDTIGDVEVQLLTI